MKVPPRRLSYFIHTSWKSALLQTLLSGITDSLKRCDGEIRSYQRKLANKPEGATTRKRIREGVHWERTDEENSIDISLQANVLLQTAGPANTAGVGRKVWMMWPSWCKASLPPVHSVRQETGKTLHVRKSSVGSELVKKGWNKASFRTHLVPRPHLLQMFRRMLRDFCKAPEMFSGLKKNFTKLSKDVSNPQLCVICFGVVKVNRYFAKGRPVPVPTILGPGALYRGRQPSKWGFRAQGLGTEAGIG